MKAEEARAASSLRPHPAPSQLLMSCERLSARTGRLFPGLVLRVVGVGFERGLVGELHDEAASYGFSPSRVCP